MAVRPVYSAGETTARGFCRAQGLAVTRTGIKNIPQVGGAVIAINHMSYLDFVQVAFAVRSVPRGLRSKHAFRSSR